MLKKEDFKDCIVEKTIASSGSKKIVAITNFFSGEIYFSVFSSGEKRSFPSLKLAIEHFNHPDRRRERKLKRYVCTEIKVCSTCHGTGLVNASDLSSEKEVCPDCEGKGELTSSVDLEKLIKKIASEVFQEKN